MTQPTGKIERKFGTKYEEVYRGERKQSNQSSVPSTGTTVPAPDRAKTSRGCGHKWNLPLLQFCAISCTLYKSWYPLKILAHH